MGIPIAVSDRDTNPPYAADLTLCEAGTLPPRYARNGALTTPAQQAQLLRGRVLLVGLGGLGGHVLDSLVRMGVGTIVGVDGDSFTESNLNRQLLCTLDSLGQSKAAAAQDYVRRVNQGIRFIPVPQFVRGPALRELVQEYSPLDVIVDALGGLDDRQALHSAAQQAGIPLVTAGIAGLTGWVQSLRPDDTGPMHYFSQTTTPSPHALSAEEVLGNLSPTVMVAAGLQCSQVYSLLTRAICPQNMLLFDLQDSFFQSLRP